MKIGYLGSGTWGFALAALLADNGHEVWLWSSKPDFVELLKQTRQHPKLPKCTLSDRLHFTADMGEALNGAEYVVESVTSTGFRPVLEKVVALGNIDCPLIVTSKGIEQNTGLLLPEVALEVLGKQKRVGCLSGPSHAEEVIKNLPTSVVSSSYDKELMFEIRDLFTSLYFRVYPNADINGVSFGGAVKNIIAIACGISDGLGFGDNTKAALMTRGLHEIRKLSVAKGCLPETLNGLAGMGDLCVTCLSTLSRNYMFGRHLASGMTPQEAKNKIGMVVEGIYTSVSALQLGKKFDIQVPITQAIYSIIYEALSPLDAVKSLLQRAIKEEHL
ncbi:MAG: NAD(P)-dependent glycerol-3-phosphate dehydrogenase [Verrucomicrobia bacterium]|nr:NAD(P)-dependent glycerol-3-phosphate dehydrogenase [Verrucomicrobiota bacterium]